MDAQVQRMIAVKHARRAGKTLLLMAALGVEYTTCERTELDCAHAVMDATDGVAAIVCEREYASTNDPRTGARLANALRRSGDLIGAQAIANGLLVTPARGDAMQILAKIAVSQHRLEDGRKLLEIAREIHAAQGSTTQLARDDQALGDIHYRQDHYADALRVFDTCIAESRQTEDRVIEGYCHLAAGQALGESGYFDGAKQEFALSEPLLTTDRDLAELEAERGALDQLYEFGPRHQNYNAQAAVEYRSALDHARRAARPQSVLSDELNLVYSLTEIGRLDEAAHYLDEARLLDIDGTAEIERTMLSARIAYHRKDLALAFDLNDQIYDKLEDGDERLNVAIMQARIALANNDPSLAEQWANRGIDVVEKRRAESALEMRPWVLSVRRQPYELLFTALVRGRRFDHALVAFDNMHARTLLDATIARANQPLTLRSAAEQTEALGRQLPMWAPSPIARTLDPKELLAKLAGSDLIALVIAEGSIWRITSRDGTIAIVEVGAFDQLEPQLEQLEATPTDTSLGDALGAKLLGDAAFRGTGTLHVILDGQLSSIPIAAVRANSKPLIATRAVVQPPRLADIGCIAPLGEVRRAVVIADAESDLSAARDEAVVVASQLGVAPIVGEAATRAALLMATDADLLHVAVHAKIDVGGGALVMHDQAVSALEIARRRTPAMVVLSACSSAVSDDDESATSLATAFLAGGSKQVIATLRPVTDAGARELAHDLYAEGIADPVRSLARVQAKLATTTNKDWPNFVIYGHDVCRKEPQ
jgi:CHAT domain-containing protein